MDRAPSPEPSEESLNPDEQRRRRRFLDNLRGWHAHTKEELSTEQDTEDFSEFWKRDDGEAESEEVDLPLELSELTAGARRMQQVGREVVGYAHDIRGFAETVLQDVGELPEATQEHIQPETSRLETATNNLTEATGKLDAELDNLDEALEDVLEAAETRPPEAAHETTDTAPPQVEKPAAKKEESGFGGMARLVIATLIGGGLGTLVAGDPERQKNRKAAKEKAKSNKVIEQQQQKLVDQQAELQALKQQRPESPDAQQQKEYVQKAGDITERQVDVTRSATEQVRVVNQQAAEVERTFQIPEQKLQQSEQLKSGPEQQQTAEVGKRPEQQKDRAGEQQEGRSEQPVERAAPQAQSHAPSPWPTSPPTQNAYSQPVEVRKQVTTKWLYVGLLAVAIAITLGLFLYSLR